MAFLNRRLFSLALVAGLLQGCGSGYPGGEENRDPDDPDAENPSGAVLYDVGGTVYNLEGTVRLKNRAELLDVTTAGEFTFTDGLAENRNYRVSVQTQPDGSVCYVEGAQTDEDGLVAAVETMAAEDVTDIQVNCYRQDVIYRASLTTDEVESNGANLEASLSYDGSFIAFASSATNLGSIATAQQIYRRDQRDGSTQLISNNSGAGNGASREPEITYNGEYIVFTSEASNLVVDDTNGVSDVFLYTASDSSLRCLSCTTSTGVSDGASYGASISRDGSKIAFISEAGNYLDSDDNGVADVFVYDTEEGELSRISLTDAEVQANGASYKADISADGNHVVFVSKAANLDSAEATAPRLYIRDLVDETTTQLATNHGDEVEFYNPSISADGTVVGYILEQSPTDSSSCILNADFTRQGDTTNCSAYVFQNGSRDRVNLTSSGTDAHGSVFAARISDSGQWMVYSSNAADIVASDDNAKIDVFLYDVADEDNTRISVQDGGEESNGNSHRPAISGDDRFVSFESDSTNLVSGILNNQTDIFVTPSGQ